MTNRDYILELAKRLNDNPELEVGIIKLNKHDKFKDFSIVGIDKHAVDFISLIIEKE
jgi:hypothetical protein